MGLPTVGDSARGLVMTTVESAVPLDLDRGFFDSAETDILSIAFEKAWAFLEFDPMLGVLEVANRRAELARCLMALLKLGETNPTWLANSAIRMLHERHDRNGQQKPKLTDAVLCENS
jgi:hypothetical protein